MAQYDINLREYWRILKKRKFVVILIAILFGVFSTVLAILRAPTPLYTSVATIEIERAPNFQGIYNRSITLSGADDTQTQMTVIKSYAVFEKVADHLGLVPPNKTGEGRPSQDVVPIIEGLKSKVEITRDSYTRILNIVVTDSRPVFAQRLANAVAQAYKEFHAQQRMKKTSDTIKYIGDQLGKVRKKLRGAEFVFNRFSQENELLSIDLQSEDLLARSKEIKEETRKIHQDQRELEGILKRLKQFIEDPTGSGHEFYTEKAGTQYQSTNNNLVELLLGRDSLLEDYTPQHPRVVALRREILENARKMALLLQLQITNREKREADFRDELKGVEKKTKVLMEKKLEFDRLKRKVELYNEMTVLLERKNQEALIRKAEKPEEVNIVKPALLPTHPNNPPKTLVTGAMGVLVGLVLGMVIGFIVETFDTSLGAIDDVEETIGTKVLGIIPQADAKDIRMGLKDKFEEETKTSSEQMLHLLSHFAPKSMVAENFRALRTNIQFKFKDGEKRVRTFAVASTTPGEGKTLVAINLAITMAQAGMKTLLVGSDLRKPGLHKIFGLEMSPGLTDVLVGNYPWRDTVKTVTDVIMGKMSSDEVMITPGLDNLHIITSGATPPNPAELIDSEPFKDFIGEAREEYDMLIFDSPPVLSTADGAILGTKMDGVLLVYRIGRVSRGLLKRSTTQLRQVECNILGVVLNGMRPDVSPDFQDLKYYRYRYYAYGGERKGKKRAFNKKDLMFPWRKRERKKRNQQVFVAEAEKGPRKEGRKDLSVGGLFVLLGATALLAGGLLWQNAVIDPLKLLDREKEYREERPKVTPKIHHTKPAIEEGEGAVFAEPMRTPSKQEGEPEVKISGLRPAEKQEPLATIETAMKQEETAGGHVALEGTSSPSEPKRAASFQEPAQKTASPSLEPASEPKGKGVNEAVPPAERALSYPFSLWVDSFQRLNRAQSAVSDYRSNGLFSYWAKLMLRDGLWYKVYIGYFENYQEAKRFRQQKGFGKAIIERTPYANLIGVYSSTDELGDKVQSLEGLGYSPYLIEDHDGRSRLFVGAFFHERRAEEQHDELSSKGIQNWVVKRAVHKGSAGTAVEANKKPIAAALQRRVSKEESPREVRSSGLRPAEKKKPVAAIETRHSPEPLSQSKGEGVSEAVPPAERALSYPFSLWVDSFQRLNRAQRAVSDHRSNGLFSYWAKLRLRDGLWYKVYIGHFEDYQQAKRFRQQKGFGKAIIERTPYANLIGVYSSTDELGDKVQSLEGLGYSPYLIEDHDGRSRLFVGAFFHERRAEEQHDELSSKGIQNKVVRR